MFLEANFVCVLSWNVLKIEIYIFFCFKAKKLRNANRIFAL
mgnify:FL=1|jgi:hypothetical protein